MASRMTHFVVPKRVVLHCHNSDCVHSRLPHSSSVWMCWALWSFNPLRGSLVVDNVRAIRYLLHIRTRVSLVSTVVVVFLYLMKILNCLIFWILFFRERFFSLINCSVMAKEKNAPSPRIEIVNEREEGNHFFLFFSSSSFGQSPVHCRVHLSPLLSQIQNTRTPPLFSLSLSL